MHSEYERETAHHHASNDIEPNPPGFIPAFHRAKLIELAAEGRTWIKPDLWASQNNAPAAKALAHVHEIFNSNPLRAFSSRLEPLLPCVTYEFIILVEEVQLISVFGADTLKRVHSFKKKVRKHTMAMT